MKRSRWLLLAVLALVALIGAVSYRTFRMGRETIGPIDGEDALAVQAFCQRFEDEPSPYRTELQIDGSTVAIEQREGLVVRRAADGKVEWSARFGDTLLGNNWQPGLVTDGRLVYFQQPECVTALDAKTGLVVWRAPVPVTCGLLSGDLLLLASGTEVVALTAASGAEAFRLSLPIAAFLPFAIEEEAGLFLVLPHPGIGPRSTFVFDRAGKIRHRIEREVLATSRAGADRLFLTSADVRRVTPEDETLWLTSFELPWALERGGIGEAPNGDFFAYLSRGNSNSGVWVMRLDPASGTARWRAHCNSLSNVAHSAYQHRATAEWVGEHLRVISLGSSGVFVEWLDGRTGKRIRRSEQREE